MRIVDCGTRFVGRFMTRRERIDMMGDRAKKFTNVYVKNFGDALDDEKMRTLFETCGLITSCRVCILPASFTADAINQAVFHSE